MPSIIKTSSIMTNSVTGYPFVDNVDQSARPTIDNPKQYLHEAYLNGYSSQAELLRSGILRQMGYRFDFKPHMKNYLYKQYGTWTEVYAPNKTALRKAIYGTIDRIIEI
jgi:hypothetical protein